MSRPNSPTAVIAKPYKPAEPSIVINGIPLSEPQVMAVRAALESFSSHLTADGLGGDAHGLDMTAVYLLHLAEIQALI